MELLVVGAIGILTSSTVWFWGYMVVYALLCDDEV